MSSLSYYVVLFLGLLAALAAAGFQVGQLTLVFGALGVGIGFGLQVVVRNFVAGLILMCERPLQRGDTVEVAGTPDLVDLVVTVVEKPTGSLSVGAGYSSAENLSLSASIQQENAFGSGHYLGFSINTSSSNRTLAINTVDPYWTVDGVSRAFDLYYRNYSPLNTYGDSYQLTTWGGGVRFRALRRNSRMSR